MRALLAAALVAVTSCAHAPPAGDIRFRAEPPIWRVNDRAPLPAKPDEREYHRSLYHADGFVIRRITRAMELRDPRRAADINSLGEVPDSTWFTNRIGTRDLSLDELRRGPNRMPGPFESRPWTLTKSKAGGMSLGFVFKDRTGAKFLLKFDEPNRPEMETAAHAIVHRILWACGYNVPEDYVGYIRRSDLRLSPTATIKDATGAMVPMSEADLDKALEKVARAPDGRIRVLASRYLGGTPIGPYAREGIRPDDPNDRIAHELRRSLRGQFPIFSWLNHTDLQEDNTLDTFEDGHVVHYLIDFGKALGVMGWGLKWKTVGHTYRLDLGIALKSLLTLGIWVRPWESLEEPKLRGIGLFDAEHYHPGEWRPNSFYWPLEDMDRFDAFWGSKILIRFTREQLRAIVDEAQLSDPRAAAYMLETLIARQRKTARYWFQRVAPLDRFAVSTAGPGARLCFTDLLLAYRLGAPSTRYEVTTFDRAGRQLGASRTLEPGRTGSTCAGAITPSAAPDAYTIVRLRVVRDGSAMPAVRVHLARRSDGVFDVIGLRRD